jgi:energy-coupling factor transport system substrate-specific component
LIVACAAWLEAGPARRKELVLIATLAAAAAAGRILFAAIPNVPAGHRDGGRRRRRARASRGRVGGRLAALVSNFYLGQGAYTPWQMVAWGACGLPGRARSRRCSGDGSRSRVFCFALGFGFDGLMNVWEWLSFYPHTWQAFTALWLRGIWFDAAHAIRQLRARPGGRTGAASPAGAVRAPPGRRWSCGREAGSAVIAGRGDAGRVPAGAPGAQRRLCRAGRIGPGHADGLGRARPCARTAPIPAARSTTSSHTSPASPRTIDAELVATAEAALGHKPAKLLVRIRRGAASRRPDRPERQLDGVGDPRAAEGR